METLMRLPGPMMTLVCHCLDRIVINDCRFTLSRPE